MDDGAPDSPPDAPDANVVVVRCAACGDTFPRHAGDEVVCPSCGSSDVHPATEPLL